MAFKKRIESSQSTSSRLPYLNVFIEEMNEKEKKKFNGTLHLITSISFPKSGKGVMVSSTSFSCFYWKKSDEWNLIESWLIDYDLDGALILCINTSIPKTYSELGTDSDYQVELIPSSIDVVTGNPSSYKVNPIPKSTDTNQEKS